MHTNHRIFDWASHERFSRLSGDRNPIHIDPIAARRTHAGVRIVHGIHSLIWALDCYAQSQLYVPRARGLKAQFLRPIYVGEEVHLEVTAPGPSAVRIRLLAGTEEVVTVSIEYVQTHRTALPLQSPQDLRMQPPTCPENRTLEEMQNVRGHLLFGPETCEISQLFPAAVGAFGEPVIFALVSSSCLVGMVVPGLHSMYSGVDLSLTDDFSPTENMIQFQVLSVARRFRSVRIGIRGQGMHGMLETISRLPPVRQASMEAVRPFVEPGEFRLTKALIIGGSRGLGELTAKLVAAGGGEVVITYATGVEDANAVAEEIAVAGSICTVASFDARQDAFAQLAAIGATPTHLYYFATPPIFRRKNAVFDFQRFAEFNAFYLEGFVTAAQACVRLRPQGIKIFYPSSSAIDARSSSMTEYAMSKAAGEILCADLCRFVPGIQILTRRLPSLLTDQTSSVVQTNSIDPIDVLLPVIRELHRADSCAD
jgi:acyl dehydratase/NAD(P)-dependent dehydrogenase (short-subunit alcohol dehydrogenase family)